MSFNTPDSSTLELIFDCGLVAACGSAIALSCKLIDVLLLTDSVLGSF
jgi:hypothetical protein